MFIGDTHCILENNAENLEHQHLGCDLGTCFNVVVTNKQLKLADGNRGETARPSQERYEGSLLQNDMTSQTVSRPLKVEYISLNKIEKKLIGRDTLLTSVAK